MYLDREIARIPAMILYTLIDGCEYGRIGRVYQIGQTGQLMNFYQEMRYAQQKSQEERIPTKWPLPRHMAPTTDKYSKSTGTIFEGFFEMFRDRDGRRVFIGQDGQYVRM